MYSEVGVFGTTVDHKRFKYETLFDILPQREDTGDDGVYTCPVRNSGHKFYMVASKNTKVTSRWMSI